MKYTLKLFLLLLISSPTVFGLEFGSFMLPVKTKLGFPKIECLLPIKYSAVTGPDFHVYYINSNEQNTKWTLTIYDGFHPNKKEDLKTIANKDVLIDGKKVNFVLKESEDGESYFWIGYVHSGFRTSVNNQTGEWYYTDEKTYLQLIYFNLSEPKSLEFKKNFDISWMK